MTSFTFEQLQVVADTYARYVGVRHVGLRLVKGLDASARAIERPRKMLVNPKVLTYSRRQQIALIIHELCHFRRGGQDHAKSWKLAVSLWGSIFQMRHVVSDAVLKVHIEKGCSGLDTYARCDECKYKYPPIEKDSSIANISNA